MPKVYVCRNWFTDILDRITPLHEMKVWEGEDSSPREVLLEEIRDIEGVISVASPIDAEIINAAPKLKIISSCSVGYDHIDVAEATRKGIPVGNTPDVLTETTADLTFSLLLASARRIVDGDIFTRQGKWRMHAHLDLLGVDVHHATLGIVGLGKIGTHVAKRAKAFNMRVLYYDAIRKIDIEGVLGVEYISDLHSLLSESDFISLNMNLTDQTRHMIGAHEFSVMKPTAILINASRGGVIDQKELYEALKSRQILRAALDVTEVEPIPPDDPLLSLDNLIITPHIGSCTIATRREMMGMAVDQLLAGLRGERIPHCVNPIVYDNL